MMNKKRLLCIGGASGMGRGIAEAGIEAGASVTITARSPEKATAIARDLGCSGFAVDITDATSVKSLFDNVGSIDHLAITAGATGRSSFKNTVPEEARGFMDGKLWATHRCIWQAKDLLDKDGSIVLVTGGYSDAATDAAGHVHIAFQAVEAMARVAAVSLAPIRCNVIRPGFIDSALWDFMDNEDRQVLRALEQSKTLTGQIVSPIELGRVAIRLMMSTPITGAVIPVDGGRHLWTAE
ncbi:MAG: SDR family oxidoreductase [Pseudomonadota bacterium]